MILIVHCIVKNRATELPQRPSPRAPHSLRTSSSDSDPIHYRSRTMDRSPKLSGGRSPRGSQSDPVNQRKLGSRIADLESQLGQAQEELKCLKDQLVSAEAAKRAAQEQLDKKSRKVKRAPNSVETHQGSNKKHTNDEYETSDDIQKETDVFEVPMESKTELDKPKSICLPFDEMKSKLDEKDKEMEVFREENVKMKSQLHEKSLKISSAESEIEELSLRLKQANHELEKSKTNAAHINEKLGATERAKEELENEMKMLRVQTEQWRKAADAAATILAGEVEMNGRRISERCGSMDKHYGNVFEPVGGYAGSPGLADDSSDDIYGGGKRKGSGIKKFGDLWRKKGNK